LPEFRQGDGQIKLIGADADLTQLRVDLKALCDAQPGQSDHKAFAKTKVDEMIYELSRHRELASAKS